MTGISTAMEQPTKKFRGRIHNKIPTEDVKPGDIVMYNAGGGYCRSVASVAMKTVMVDQPKGMKPRTKRINREDIKEVWRWRGKTESVSGRR